MTLAAAVLLHAAYRLASYVISRRQGYAGSWPVGSLVLGVWAAYLLVA
jgi:hypothetical protein